MKKKLINVIVVAVIFVIIGLYYTHPNRCDSADTENGIEVIEAKGRVLSVDNSEITPGILTSIGTQTLSVEVLSGDYKGQIFDSSNGLNGNIEYENIYEVDDIIIFAIQRKDGEIINTRPVDIYRQTWLFILFLFFVATLLIYSGIIGVNSLLSFLLSLIVLWEYFIKGLLNGQSPLMLTITTVILLSSIIIFLVAGLTKKGLSAFLSTIFGLFVTLILTHFFGNRIGLHGLTQAYVINVVQNSGNYSLDIQQIFYAAVVLGASGAAMDISMDIAASMDEIKKKKADIELRELIQSGFTVGRHVIGTMATTLLLAYSGSYLTLLMYFQVKNPSFVRIINLKMVSSEIMRTLIGSTGLILVAPLTAVITGIILTKEFSIFNKSSKPSEE